MAATFTDAYWQAGYRLTSPRNQWSAIKADGSSVALTIWADQITKNVEPWEWDTRDHPRIDEWKERTGNAMRKKHLRHAIDACGGRVDLILCRAVDASEEPRRVASARFWKERIGVLDPECFDEATGAFRVLLHPR